MTPPMFDVTNIDMWKIRMSVIREKSRTKSVCFEIDI